MNQYRNEVLELQALETDFGGFEGSRSSTPILGSIAGGVAGGIVNGAWNSTISFGCR